MKPVSRNILAITAALVIMFVAACAPQVNNVSDTVLPQLFNVRVDPEDNTRISLQGRYFGPESETSHVLVGADMNRNGGVVHPVVSWTGNRIELRVSRDLSLGYIFVIVDGTPSNGLPANR